MYLSGHQVVSVLAFTAPFLLSDDSDGFSQPSNRRQLLRYLSRLSKESSSIQWCYDLYYTVYVRYGLPEIINVVTIFLGYKPEIPES